MMQGTIPLIDRTTQETNIWLNEISKDLSGVPPESAYHALRAVLFATRDCLVLNEAVHFSAQLPTLIRGIFFEGYRPADVPKICRSQDEFLRRIDQELQKTAEHPEPELAARAVFTVIEAYVSKGESAQVKDMLHKEVQDLWPSAA